MHSHDAEPPFLGKKGRRNPLRQPRTGLPPDKAQRRVNRVGFSLGRLDGLAPPSPARSAPALGGTGGGGRWKPTLSSRGTLGRVLTPLMARWSGERALSAPGRREGAELSGDHHAPREPRSRCWEPTGRASVFQAPPDTGTRCLHVPAPVRTQAPAAGVTHATSPEISRWGGRGSESGSREQPGGWSRRGRDVSLMGDEPDAWHLTKPPSCLFNS